MKPQNKENIEKILKECNVETPFKTALVARLEDLFQKDNLIKKINDEKYEVWSPTNARYNKAIDKAIEIIKEL